MAKVMVQKARDRNATLARRASDLTTADFGSSGWQTKEPYTTYDVTEAAGLAIKRDHPIKIVAQHFTPPQWHCEVLHSKQVLIMPWPASFARYAA